MDARDLRARLVANGVSSRIADIVAGVPRDLFVPENLTAMAWRDHALPIGHGQTISQPTVVAVMTEAVDVGPGDQVLDVGTGTGYQAAVLAACGARVHSVERIPALADRARGRLTELGFDVAVSCGDGALGRPDLAPFDAIVVAAATPEVPPALVEQLREPGGGRRGGRLVLPLGRADAGAVQLLTLIERTAHELRRRVLLDVLFVPLVRDRPD